MAIDIGMKYLDDINEVDVLQIVRQLRRQRAGAVQTEQQYAFIYRVSMRNLLCFVKLGAVHFICYINRITAKKVDLTYLG